MTRPALDPRAWGCWLASLALVTLWVRNPLYLAIVLLVSQLLAARPAADKQMPALRLWRLGAVMLFFSGVFNLAFVHNGVGVLWRLPASWPLIGGAWTWEAAVAGLINGLTLWTLLVAFVAFNQAVDPDELVRLGPRALHDVGVVVLIALTYVPQTLQQWQRIREAQAIRGHRLRGWRDWRPLLLPLLVGGLERALALAESLVARGYGRSAESDASTPQRLALFGGLLLALAGWVAALWWGWPGWLLLALGFGLLVGVTWGMGRQTPVSRFRPKPWHRHSTLLILLALIPLLVVTLGRADISYNPYPRLVWPPFQPWLGLALLLFAAPLTLEPSSAAA